ncbi:MAG: hypothetical protein R3D00_04445 [Bacteroidia bacterium]
MFNFATAQQRSVVLINTEAGSGYGVAWGAPNQIVTALHLVSGRNKIKVVWEGKTVDAKIEKIHKPADLALLKLASPLSIPLLETFESDAPTSIDLNYWELKIGSKLMTSKTTQLQKQTTLGKIDPRLADPKLQTAFAEALCTDGQANYPRLNTSIIKFSEKNIEKAHSGSPITFGNKIVGIVDGGEKPVNGSVLVWAIPATEFQNLITKGTSVAGAQTPCSSVKLYSGLRSDNPLLNPDLLEMAKTIEYSREHPITKNGDNGFSFSLAYRTNCRDFYGTLFPEDQEYIREIVELGEDDRNVAEKLSIYDLYGQKIDIYQDARTGATVAVPTNSKINIQQEGAHTLVEISSKYDGITMYIYLSHNETMEETRDEMAWFKEYLVSDGRPWELDEDFPDEEPIDYTDDEYDPYYFEDMQRVVIDEDNNVTAEFYARLTISDTDFMGVSVQVNDWETLEEDKYERLMSYLLEACATITDFPY